MGPLADNGRKRNRLIVVTWNVEGLSEAKVIEICCFMRANSIDIVCMQETRRAKSDNFVTDDGYEFFLSGRGDTAKEWAGVGFILSPHVREHCTGFQPFCSRLACLRVRVVGGIMCIFQFTHRTA